MNVKEYLKLNKGLLVKILGSSIFDDKDGAKYQDRDEDGKWVNEGRGTVAPNGEHLSGKAAEENAEREQPAKKDNNGRITMSDLPRDVQEQLRKSKAEGSVMYHLDPNAGSKLMGQNEEQKSSGSFKNKVAENCTDDFSLMMWIKKRLQKTVDNDHLDAGQTKELVDATKEHLKNYAKDNDWEQEDIDEYMDLMRRQHYHASEGGTKPNVVSKRVEPSHPVPEKAPEAPVKEQEKKKEPVKLQAKPQPKHEEKHDDKAAAARQKLIDKTIPRELEQFVDGDSREFQEKIAERLENAKQWGKDINSKKYQAATKRIIEMGEDLSMMSEEVGDMCSTYKKAAAKCQTAEEINKVQDKFVEDMNSYYDRIDEMKEEYDDLAAQTIAWERREKNAAEAEQKRRQVEERSDAVRKQQKAAGVEPRKNDISAESVRPKEKKGTSEKETVERFLKLREQNKLAKRKRAYEVGAEMGIPHNVVQKHLPKGRNAVGGLTGNEARALKKTLKNSKKS